VRVLDELPLRPVAQVPGLVWTTNFIVLGIGNSKVESYRRTGTVSYIVLI